MKNDQEKAQESYRIAARDAWDADPLLTVSEWADLRRILPQKGAAEPGPYRTDRTPYMREVMDCLSATSPVQDINLMAGAQLGKSEAGNNWVGYVIDHAPGPMLLVEPTVDNAKRYSKQRIGPMIQESPSLAEKVIDNKSRDSSNTMLEKEFPGGILLMGGANSAAGLRSMPIRYFFGDEISNWPADVDGEGDPLMLASERTNTFARRKLYKCSTPGIKGVCRIEAEYLNSDRRRYFVPCPHCGHMHTLQWANFRIPKDEETGKRLPRKAHMACPECGGVIEEHHKTEMLKDKKMGGSAEWRATNPDWHDPLRRGYWINSLYSPVGWKSWAKIAQQWLNAQGNPKLLQAFVNNVLAETWEEAGEKVDEGSIQARAENYGHDPLPDGALVITIGVDVQPDRLEAEVVAWGLGEESWSLNYHVLRGDPNSQLVWQQLDALILTEYQHPAGVKLRSARTFIDSGGSNTIAVYDYVREREGWGVYAIKGMAGDGRPAVGNPTKNNIGKIPLFPVGTFAIKDTIYGRLRLAEHGPGFCHFPTRYGLEFYQQLTAEEVRTKFSKGFPVREWHKKSDSHRNEALDCRVYSTAAMLSLNLNFDQLAKIMDGSLVIEAPARRIRGEMEAAA